MAKARSSSSAQQVHYLSVGDITPYALNPRNNEPAIEAVISSIMQFGFRIPIVVAGDDNTIVAGHTRWAAVKRILERDPSLADRFESIPCFRADDLTEEQIRAFRVVDNKTSELAEWDFDLLAGEVDALAEAGITLTDFGWSQEEIDCLRTVVAEDCLDPATWQQAQNDMVGDGVNKSFTPMRELGKSADGSSIRVTVGTFGFMVLRDDFEAWFDKLMKDNSFDFEQANDAVARMLDLKDAKDKRVEVLYRISQPVQTAEATVAVEDGEAQHEHVQIKE